MEEKKIESLVSEEHAKELEEAADVPSNVRELSGWTQKLFYIIAIVGALFHLYILNFHPIDPWLFRTIHLAFGAVLGLLLFNGWKTKSNRISIVDWLLIAGILFITFYIYFNMSQLMFRLSIIPTTMDVYVSHIRYSNCFRVNAKNEWLDATNFGWDIYALRLYRSVPTRDFKS